MLTETKLSKILQHQHFEQQTNSKELPTRLCRLERFMCRPFCDIFAMTLVNNANLEINPGRFEPNKLINIKKLNILFAVLELFQQLFLHVFSPIQLYLYVVRCISNKEVRQNHAQNQHVLSTKHNTNNISIERKKKKKNE